MKVAVLGGGPAGLYFAISMKLRDASHDVTVIERNRADDTFGWGVVLSDETLDNLARNDAASADSIRAHFAYWDDIAVIHDGVRTLSTGHGFCGIGRKTLLQLLQARAAELGVELQFSTEAGPVADYMAEYDLVVAADGVNSKARAAFPSLGNSRPTTGRDDAACSSKSRTPTIREECTKADLSRVAPPASVGYIALPHRPAVPSSIG